MVIVRSVLRKTMSISTQDGVDHLVFCRRRDYVCSENSARKVKLRNKLFTLWANQESRFDWLPIKTDIPKACYHHPNTYPVHTSLFIWFTVPYFIKPLKSNLSQPRSSEKPCSPCLMLNHHAPKPSLIIRCWKILTLFSTWLFTVFNLPQLNY